MTLSAATRALRLALLATLALVGLAALALAPAQDRPAQDGPAHILTIDGAISPATTDYLRRSFDRAEAAGAGIIVLRMDTPGGLDTAMREIIQTILASPIPVVTHVAPTGARAASAGTYILYASHVAAMAPSTNLGAATPVQMGAPGGFGADEEDGEGGRTDMEAKAINDAVAYIRGLAELRGRDVSFAEDAVREAASISSSEALERGVIEIVAADTDALMAELDGREVTLSSGQTRILATTGIEAVEVQPDWRANILAALANPNLAFILMLIGIYGIIFELASPGSIGPGVIGAVALILALFSLNLLPVNYAGLGLLILGIALMTAEAFLPSFGILGIGGAVAFVLGAVFLFDADIPGMSIDWPVIAAATAASALILAVILASVVRAHSRRVATGAEALAGQPAEVLEWAEDRGRVRFHGEIWQARSSEPLAPRARVRIVRRDGLILTVAPEKAQDTRREPAP